MEILNIAGAGMTMVMRCLGLFFPQRAAEFTGLKAVTVPGRSEFWSTFGGLFLLAGLVPLITLEPAAFLTIVSDGPALHRDVLSRSLQIMRTIRRTGLPSSSRRASRRCFSRAARSPCCWKRRGSFEVRGR